MSEHALPRPKSEPVGTSLPPASDELEVRLPTDGESTRQQSEDEAVRSRERSVGFPDIDGYILEAELGIGGMGVVYRATQLRMFRTVAIKVVHGGRTADPRELIRFLAEAEAVAAIEHANVVRVYDTGDTAGSPYLAMEYLPGGTLAKKLLQSGRFVPCAAAELIRKLALGVQAAHDNQIVHRDLKPSNVMFDAAGEPKLTDFGLAKRAGGSDLTATQAIMGTPAYMAPEQAKGENKFVGPQADVWALGAMLYECLAGRKPFTGDSDFEVIEQVVKAEPPSLRRVSSEVPRDLELIVQKCLQKNASKRYGSAKDLASDLERWLAGIPVSVKAAGPVERSVKWVRRNKLAAGIMAASVLAAVAMTGLAVWAVGESRRADAAARRAENERGKALESAELASEREREAVAERDAKEKQRKYAQAIADFVQNDFFALTSVDGQLRFGSDTSPTRASERLTKDATLRHLLERAARKLKARTDLDPLTEADLSWILGENFRGVGDYPQAIMFLERCHQIRSRELGTENEQTLNVGNSLAVAYQDAGRLQDAIRLFEQVRDSQIRTLGAEHSFTLTTMNNLAISYQAAGRLPEAIRLFEQVRDAAVQSPGVEHPSTLNALANLAVAYRDGGRLDEAITIFKQVRDAEVRKFGADHPYTLTTLDNLAGAYLAAARLPEAIQLYEQVRDAQIAQLGADHPDILTTLNNLAVAYREAGRLDEAIPLLEKARDAQVAQLGADHPFTLTTFENLAWAYMDAERLSEAIPLLEQAAEGIERRKFQHEHAARIITSTIMAYEAAGDHTQADRWRRKWFDQLRAVGQGRTAEFARDLAAWSFRLLERGEWSEAETTLRECVAIRKAIAPTVWSTFYAESMLGAALTGQSKYAEAEPLLISGYDGMLASREQIPPQASNRIREACQRLVDYYGATGQPAEANQWRAKLPREVAPPPQPGP